MRRTLGKPLALKLAVGFVEKAHDGGMHPGGVAEDGEGIVEEEGGPGQDGKRGFGQVADVVDDEKVLDEGHEAGQGSDVGLVFGDEFPDAQAVGGVDFAATGRTVLDGGLVEQFDVLAAASWAGVQEKTGRVAGAELTPAAGGEMKEGGAQAGAGIVGIDTFAFAVQLGVYGGAKAVAHRCVALPADVGARDGESEGGVAILEAGDAEGIDETAVHDAQGLEGAHEDQHGADLDVADARAGELVMDGGFVPATVDGDDVIGKGDVVCGGGTRKRSARAWPSSSDGMRRYSQPARKSWISGFLSMSLWATLLANSPS